MRKVILMLLAIISLSGGCVKYDTLKYAGDENPDIDFDISENIGTVNIAESRVYIWNDYMLRSENHNSLCSCYIEVTSSYNNTQNVELSAVLSANSLGRSPVIVYNETISHDFSNGSFKYEFRPDYYGTGASFHLKDKERYSMEIIINIDQDRKSVIHMDKVMVTS